MEGDKLGDDARRGEGSREGDWRTFLDLGFLHLVVEGLLQVSFVVV